MEGKKAFTGFSILALGLLGAGEVVTDGQIADAVNSVFVLAGFVQALYGYLVTKRGSNK